MAYDGVSPTRRSGLGRRARRRQWRHRKHRKRRRRCRPRPSPSHPLRHSHPMPHLFLLRPDCGRTPIILGSNECNSISRSCGLFWESGLGGKAISDHSAGNSVISNEAGRCKGFFLRFLLESNTSLRWRRDCVCFWSFCSSAVALSCSAFDAHRLGVAHQSSLRSPSTMMSFRSPFAGRRVA